MPVQLLSLLSECSPAWTTTAVPSSSGCRSSPCDASAHREQNNNYNIPPPYSYTQPGNVESDKSWLGRVFSESGGRTWSGRCAGQQLSTTSWVRRKMAPYPQTAGGFTAAREVWLWVTWLEPNCKNWALDRFENTASKYYDRYPFLPNDNVVRVITFAWAC